MTSTIVLAPTRTHCPPAARRGLTLAERAVQLHDDGARWDAVSVQLGLSRHQLVAVLARSGYYQTVSTHPSRW